MVNKNKLDNLSAEEIKEMITAEAIIFESLDSVSLEKLLAYETELLCHGSGDMEFISRCAQRLTAIGDYATKSAKTTSDFASLVDNTITENVTILPAQQAQTKNTQKKKRFSLKHIAVIAAAVLILSTATVVSTTSDNYWGWNLVKDKEVGYTIEYSGISYTRGGTVQHYSTIEELKETEDLTDWNFLYPTKLPENLVIESVHFVKHSAPKNEPVIRLICNENYMKNHQIVFFYVEKNVPERNIWEEVTEQGELIYETNGMAFLIYMYDDIYHAACWYNGDYYSIHAGNYEDLILIIDNLKVLED